MATLITERDRNTMTNALQFYATELAAAEATGNTVVDKSIEQLRDDSLRLSELVGNATRMSVSVAGDKED